MKPFHFPHRLGSVLLAVHLVEPVQADLIAYDGADYAPTASIAGLNGGTGWNGAWTGINNVVSGSLVMNGVATTGNRFVTEGGNFGSSRVIATAGFEALLNNGRFGKDGTTLWLSYLFRAVSNSANNYSNIALYDGPVSNENQVLYLGVPTGQSTLTIYSPPTNTYVPSSVSGMNPQTLFIVVKLMFGTANGDRVFLYVNPSVDFEPTSNHAAVANDLNFQFDRVFFASGQTATIASFDEIRLGETFADVVPLAPDRYVVTQRASFPASATRGTAISPLVQDAQGRFFGAAPAGGAAGAGSVFRVNEDGSEFTVLREFPAFAGDGKAPSEVGLARDGRLYGGTHAGGTGGIFGDHGVAYRMNTDGGDYTILRHFDTQTDGAWMAAALLEDSEDDGVLYGVLRSGGTATLADGGHGTIFKINADGTGFAGRHLFINPLIVPASTDGFEPRTALIEGPDQKLYGTTVKGGTGLTASGGLGTVFRIGKDGSGYQVIWNFQPDGRGSIPESRLLYASDGYLYGTTDTSHPAAAATIFKLKPDGSEYTVLRAFGGGHLRQGALVEMPDGLLYGTASESGRVQTAEGNIYRIAKDGSDFEVLHDFLPGVPNGGRRPWGGLIKGRDGALYGATFTGGAENAGTLFALERTGTGTGGPAIAPVILNPVFSVADRTFSFSIAGAPLAQYEVQATDAPPAWQPIGALQTAPDGSAHFSEQVPPGVGVRFYRVVGS